MCQGHLVKGQQLQNLTHLLLDCPASEAFPRTIFGSILPFLTSGPGLGAWPTVGSPWSSSVPHLSEGKDSTTNSVYSRRPAEFELKTYGVAEFFFLRGFPDLQ